MSKNIEEVADLACLKFSKDELDTFQHQFDQILNYFNSLNELNTDNVLPMVTPHDRAVGLRSDEVKSTLSVEELLQNAPDTKDNLFKVPPVV